MPTSETSKISLITTPLFWQKLQAFYTLMRPIHESQKMSESNRATSAHVYPRWIGFNTHFQNNRAIGPFTADINAYLNRVERGGWSNRIKKQLLPIHTAAYIFTPLNHAAEIMPASLQALEANAWQICLDSMAQLSKKRRPIQFDKRLLVVRA
ncbi:hypothetical protein Golomagni_01975 [Golovinomyces magnicellulatus]|nr:hypothetical protein Golomagni_01975 [Golovinomyces magnicellulatus]